MVNRERDPEVLLEPVPKSSATLPCILNWTVDGWAFVLVNDLTFCSLVSLSLGAMSKSLMVLDPLKCTWIPFLLHVLLNLAPNHYM